MKFGLIGISFLFKLKYEKVSLAKIIFYLFIPDLIYLGLTILQIIGLSQFPPVLTPSPDLWGHSLVVSGIIGGLTAAYILLDNQDRENLILCILPSLAILLGTYSIFYITYYFYPFFENINTIFIKANIEFSKYLQDVYGQYTTIGMSVWPYETIYWVIDLLTLLLCIVISLWRIATTEFEEKIVTQVEEDLIIPSDYTLIYKHPQLEVLSFDEDKVYTQKEWEDIATKIRNEIISFRQIQGASLDFEYKYPDFKGFINKIEKPLFQGYEKRIKKIYIQLNPTQRLDEKKLDVYNLKIPMIKKGKLFLIQVSSFNKILQRELLYIADDGFPVFINREKPHMIKTDYTKFNDVLLNEEPELKNLIEFDFRKNKEEFKLKNRVLLLKIIQQFIMLYGCFRERIIYSNQEVDKWRVYDYRDPEKEYKIDLLPIRAVEIYKLKNSIGVNLWTWADYHSKWALIFYQFQLFADGFHPSTFPFYRIPIYSGMLSQDD
ncbi:MAG: hypothetical protein ACTSO9_04580 [Candidatus Helarchaeota archaeon]